MSFFEDIQISYEGKNSINPLAFKYYNRDEIVYGKKMEDHLRFAVAFWHTMNGTGQDMFGEGTMCRPWDSISDPIEKAKAKIDGVFEFCEKLGVKFFCFHDRDIAPEGETLRDTNKNLDIVVDYVKEKYKRSKVRLLWGTASLFTNKRFMHGASTTSNADVFAYSAAQVKKALEITKELEGKNYVFWGGREGYETLLNTNYKLEQENLARFFHMAVDYAEKIGFKGQFLIEPKPMEPTKHQYDYDSANAYAFLLKNGLQDKFKMNLEVNHATLAGHSFEHEIRYARTNGILGSLDANQGDMFLGWDTDQFPTNTYITTLAMYEVLKAGGINPGGLNFDAKLRRPSIDLEDMFIGHIAGMDSFALGLKAAAYLIEEGILDKFVKDRYSSFDSGIGKDIVEGKEDFSSLEKYILDKGEIENKSGKQEYLETLITRAIIKAAE